MFQLRAGFSEGASSDRKPEVGVEGGGGGSSHHRKDLKGGLQAFPLAPGGVLALLGSQTPAPE